ncbi:MAG: hypothetical protein CL470_08375 [Acidimicrobiaceae bacterium]|nr:hypothetical protein [Acidimicrobiaceae bacterium]
MGYLNVKLKRDQIKIMFILYHKLVKQKREICIYKMIFIKLIYDKFENENRITRDKETDEGHKYEVLLKVNDRLIDVDRTLTICTWGIKEHLPYDCDIIFDITLFSTKVEGDSKGLTGMDDKIQQSIIDHPKFDIMMEEIIMNIECSNSKVIGIICNYGKQLSVGWAELLKKMYYTKSLIRHRGIDHF